MTTTTTTTTTTRARATTDAAAREREASDRAGTCVGRIAAPVEARALAEDIARGWGGGADADLCVMQDDRQLALFKN